MERERKKINNAEEMMDALVEDYFRSDDLAQIETEAIRHNITGSDTEVLEYEDFTRCLGSSDVLELGEKSSFHLIQAYHYVMISILA